MSFLQTCLGALHSLEWVGILLARLTVGLLFLLTGQGKLFRTQSRERMRQSLQSAGIPFPRLSAVAVSVVEFVFGGLLVLGALTPLACVMLSGVMVVALATTKIQSIRASSPSEWLSRFLYLPEVLYLVLLVWLFFSGPGRLSVDEGFLSLGRM
jgi:putative oxidoreductase